MFVKSLTVDGFKSYGKRTEINGFDRQFNAITGLNGSGKSNILDSICFVLGISNLNQVRASNLQELVYKSGQAGVNKATVSITFDNTKKDDSPMGYDQYDEITITRQVVIGGRNKYLINGCNATNTRVADLFQSVQLNVNNPHFLIMQGRITKVLNMKPPEILSMIEEAAGTRMYESKKQNAQKTITKKDSKLQEIDTILNEEITPTLTKLKDERSSYLEFQKVQREYENLNKLYVAFQFVTAQGESKKFDDEYQNKHQENKTLNGQVVEMKTTVSELEEKIKSMEEKRDAEAGGTLKQLEATLKETQMAETKMNAAVKHQKDAVNEEKKKKKELEKNSQEDLATINNKEKESRKYRDVLDNFQKKCQKDADDLEAAQTRYQAICAGLSTNTDGQEATLADQLMAAKNEIASSETETKRAEMRLKHAEVELKKKENECKKTEQGYEKDKASHDKAEVNVKRIGDRLGSLEYEDGCEEKLSGDRRDVSKKLSRLSENMERIEAKYPDLKFEYKDPEKNFDRRKVYGPVCNLFRVKDNRHTTALEVCAGGKLHNIVVDSEETCKKLLKNGQLKRRYTFIPLSKISGSVIGNQVANKAERLVGKENVSPALSLVEYDPELCPAMEYVFGSWFVCKDMNSAMEVTFNESIMTPSVTIDGDKVDPSGTLSGGSRSNIRSVLSGVNEFNSKRTEYDATKRQLDSVDNKIKSMRHVADKYRSLKNEYELKNHELELLKTRLHAGAHHQQLEEVLSLNKMIEEQKETFRRCGDVKKKAEAKVRDLESKLKDSKSYREKELKAAEDEIAACKKNAEQSNQKYKEKQQEVESNNLELEELRGAIVGYRQQAEQVDVVVEKQVQELLELTEKADRAKDEVEHLQGELKAHKDLLKAHNKDIAEQQARRDSLIKKINHNNLQIQRCEHEINKYHRDAKDAYAKVEHLLSTYDWIVEDKKYFGQANTAYDFVGFKASDAGRHLQKLEERKDKMSKHVNMRAMNMLGQAEEQYNDLINKKRIVENDKATIEAVIRELDEKKNEALRNAWQQINKDFGSIFSTLLPGTKAKLVPPEGMNVLDGLEVKVAFGDVWKDSLQELSGGQRSLVALSLILSLLLFKPAPIYILDEVDAALDLNHTQNIGQMIRTHFKHSQFIVVSLKDGMFNNANVLFKTKFVDGMSTVGRFAQHSTSSSRDK